MSIPLRNFGKTGVRISVLSLVGFISAQVGSALLLRLDTAVSSSLLKSAMNMNSGAGTNILRMLHMSSVVD